MREVLREVPPRQESTAHTVSFSGIDTPASVVPGRTSRYIRPIEATSDGYPIPSGGLAWRVGCPQWARRPDRFYLKRGNDLRQAILAALPADWSFAGTRVLDFGCGAGRVLRHFAPEAAIAQLWGCDVHEPSVDWMRRHLCPPLHAFHSGEAPPLDQPDASFDLVWALSVFYQITDQWSAWLAEIHRVLGDGGLFLATFKGEGVSQSPAFEPWIEDCVGMNLVAPGRGWDRGRAMVQHSPWWITDHWGRGFDVVSMHPFGFARLGRKGEGWVLLRKRPGHLVPEDFERPRPDEPRELAAARHNVDQLYAELVATNRTPGMRLQRFLGELRQRPVDLARRVLTPAEHVPVPETNTGDDRR